MESFGEKENTWPKQQEVYGWLALDRRGFWSIKGKKILNPKLTKFISDNYRIDNLGRCFFQNGEQRVFVSTALAPYVVNVTDINPLGLETHNGIKINKINTMWFDKNMCLFLKWDNVIGSINDRDNPYIYETLTDSYNNKLSSKGQDGIVFDLNGQAKNQIFLTYNGCKIQIMNYQEAEHLIGFFQTNPKPVIK